MNVDSDTFSEVDENSVRNYIVNREMQCLTALICLLYNIT